MGTENGMQCVAVFPFWLCCECFSSAHVMLLLCLSSNAYMVLNSTENVYNSSKFFTFKSLYYCMYNTCSIASLKPRLASKLILASKYSSPTSKDLYTTVMSWLLRSNKILRTYQLQARWRASPTFSNCLLSKQELSC